MEHSYRTAVFIPLLDETIHDVDRRSKTDESDVVCQLNKLVPTIIVTLEESEVKRMVEILHLKYSSLVTMSGKTLFLNKVLLWQTKWRRSEIRPSEVLWIPPTKRYIPQCITCSRYSECCP